MNVYDFVQLSLLALGGEVKGKTKLQKTIYFLGIATDNSKELGYRAHFYGPYSPDVADAMDNLRALGFVEQSVASAGAYDASGFEVARHDFKLTDAGRRIAEAKRDQNPTDWKKIESAIRLLNRAGDLDYVKLSIAAKTYFMLGEKKGAATHAELAELANKFGWTVTPDQISEAGKYLAGLKLVEYQNQN